MRGDPSEDREEDHRGKKLQSVEVVTGVEAGRGALPERVRAALGELVGVAQEGLLALSVGVGLGVLAELMEEEVVDVVGPRSRPDPVRFAYRHGRERGEVVLGGRVLPVERPRARRADGSGEVELETYRHFADRDPLDRVVLERMLAGVSCRRYPRTQEPVGEQVELEARSVSRSALSRRFSERTRQAFGELISRRLDGLVLAVLMLDGIELQGRTNVVALGITTDGAKIPLGLWEGSTENPGGEQWPAPTDDPPACRGRPKVVWRLGREKLLVRPLKTFDRKLPLGIEWGHNRPVEVAMRPASVFVRSLAPVEGQRLKRLSRRAKHASTRQRAMILLASATLMSPPEIARMLMSDESHVRKVIHDFNERGFDSLRPRFGGGRPRRISSEDEQRIVALAGARPDSLGVPFTRWSLAKLSCYLRGQAIPISPAQLGRLLKRAGLSFQRTRSWKQSPDPDYQAKAERILALYRERPANGVVISFDEKGPESLCPKHGRGWAGRGRPERHRATYNRRHGVRYLVGALDVHADYLRARLRPRRDGASTLVFMKQIRLAYPRRLRLYWIQDNLSCHWTREIREWAAASNVELVPTPTYASFLNRIESHFGAIDEFVCANADYLDWDAFDHAMGQHIRHRNTPEARAERKAQAEQRRRRQRERQTITRPRLAA